jgi:flagellar FliJ protein
MKRFRFTLEAVRTVRQQQEQKAMEGYAASLMARQQALRQLEEAERELDNDYHDLRLRMEKGCDAATASHAISRQRELVKKRDAYTDALSVAERRLNISHQKMLEARQQREVTDKFYDNQKQKFLREEIRVEQKLLDELAGRRAVSHSGYNQTRI